MEPKDETSELFWHVKIAPLHYILVQDRCERTLAQVHVCLPHPLSPAAGGWALSGGGGGSQAWGLYRCTHRADCELRLGGHDVCGLDVAVVHWVLKCGPNICVLMASVTIERNLRSSPGNKSESD